MIETPAPKRHGTPRRFLTGFALLLACLLVVAATLTTWTQQVLLNTDRYVAIVGDVPSDPAVQASIADFVSSQVITALDVQTKISQVLPDKAEFLAAPITSALQDRLRTRVLGIVSTDAFAQFWATAQGRLHDELVRVLRGQSTVLTIDQGVLYLNLYPLIGVALTELQSEGFIPASITLPDFSGNDPGPVAQKLSAVLGVTIPPTFGQFPLIEASALTTAQTFVKVLDALVIILWLLVILVIALAIWAAANRRRMILYLAIGSIAALVLARLLITTIEGAVVSGIADNGAAATVKAIVDFGLGNLFAFMWWFVALAAIAAAAVALQGRSAQVAQTVARVRPTVSRPDVSTGSLRSWVRDHEPQLRWAIPVAVVAVIAAVVVGLQTALIAGAVIIVFEFVLNSLASEPPGPDTGAAPGRGPGVQPGLNRSQPRRISRTLSAKVRTARPPRAAMSRMPANS